MPPQQPQKPSPTKSATPLPVPNFFVAIALTISRSYLFIAPIKKAAFFVLFITTLSIISPFVSTSVDDAWYIVQKQNIFNQYGVKLGWFWTCFFVGPFIWFSSRNSRGQLESPVKHLFRLVVATMCWYFVVDSFHKLTRATSRCEKNHRWSRIECKENGSAWLPGWDISGHCFLMLYSILIMSEEAISFRYWDQMRKNAEQNGKDEVEKITPIVQYFFIGMLALNLFWIKQLVISTLFYHIFIDKVVGALIAVLCWFVTYKMIYPATGGLLLSPIQRKKQNV